MTTRISGNLGVDKVKDNTLVVADIKAGEVVGFQKMQLFAAKATTSGTFVDFSPADGTGIPSWAKRVTVVFAGVSTNGASPPVLQIGAGSVDTTGYIGGNAVVGTSAVAGSTATNGFSVGAALAANTLSGSAIISNISGNLWACSGTLALGTSPGFCTFAGHRQLAGPLDRIRLTTGNGTDTFDAGSVSILVEGYE